MYSGDIHRLEQFKMLRFHARQNAVNDGDRHVALLDGRTFFDENQFDLCLNDFGHSNDHSFGLMAQKVLPALSALLENAN